MKGKLEDEATRTAVSEAQVAIPYLKMLTVTNGNGDFNFSHVPFGIHRLVICGSGIKADTISININKEAVNLGTLMVYLNDAAPTAQTFQIPFITIEDNNEADTEAGNGGNVSSLLSASRDPFVNTLAFVFGPYRFQARGYERSQQQVLINGAPMNDVETGDIYWNQWGGLNDVFRGKSNTYGLQPSDYAFGGINGTTTFDATAINQIKQTRVTYSLTNRQYRNRFMITHSSGLIEKGWAYSLSFSKRWAEEGYIPGTSYDGYSYYAAVSKRFRNRHNLNLTVFGAPTKRGKTGPSFRESYKVLSTNFYNPNWGHQDGKKRNAKTGNIHQPVIVLNYQHSPSESLRWNTSIGYQFGKNKNSMLDWYNAPDPRPDYYKKLPSFTNASQEFYPNLSEKEKQENIQAFMDNSQIQWDELYEANKLNNGRSLYVIGEDVDDIKKWLFNTQLQKPVNEYINLQTGISALKQSMESYREMSDLLGGTHYLNVNSFNERNFAGSNIRNQNDVNNPNQMIKKGDKYFYAYELDFLKAWWWGQAQFTYKKVDFFLAASYGVNSFQRKGLFKNGVFEDDSYGKGKRQSFNIYGLKGGITYKINGRHYLFANAAYMTDAPTIDNTYFSARVRNTVVENPTVQKTASMEVGYLLRAPKANIRAVGYATERRDAVEVQRLFYEGSGSANSMIAYVLQNVRTRYTGVELAAEYKLTSAFSATAIAAIGQAFYLNDPTATGYFENALDSAISEKAYFNNTFIGIGPQSAYTLGLNYRSRGYWSLNMNFNYFERTYVDPAAPRRTEQAVEGVEAGSDKWHAILEQEELPSVFTVDLYASKTILLSKKFSFLPRNTYLYLNVGINNFLNNKNIATGGFENARFDYEGTNVSKFASKYFYGYGRNYFINLSFKF